MSERALNTYEHPWCIKCQVCVLSDLFLQIQHSGISRGHDLSRDVEEQRLTWNNLPSHKAVVLNQEVVPFPIRHWQCPEMFVVVILQAIRLLLARKARATSKCSTRQVYPPTEFVHQRFRGQKLGTGCLYCRILLKMQLTNVEMYLSCYHLSICWQLILEKSWFTVQGLAWTVIRYPYMRVHFRDSCLLSHCVAFLFFRLTLLTQYIFLFYNWVFQAVLDIDTEWKPTWTPLMYSVSSWAVALCPTPAGSEVRLVRTHTAVYLFMEIAASMNRGSKYSRAGHSCQ